MGALPANSPEASGAAPGARTPQRSVRPTSRTRAPGRRPAKAPERSRTHAWNVLAEEIVPFPPYDVRPIADRSARTQQTRRRPTADEMAAHPAARSRSRVQATVSSVVTAPAVPRHQVVQLDEHRARSAAPQGAAHVRSTTSARRPVGLVRTFTRALPGLATVVVLAAIWLGAGSLAALHQPHTAIVPGSVKTTAGYVYTVRPGDTLWSIASQLEPGTDPRPVVDQLAQQLHGGTLVPGLHLRLP
jgi:LysM repeat protein